MRAVHIQILSGHVAPLEGVVDPPLSRRGFWEVRDISIKVRSNERKIGLLCRCSDEFRCLLRVELERGPVRDSVVTLRAGVDYPIRVDANNLCSKPLPTRKPAE